MSKKSPSKSSRKTSAEQKPLRVNLACGQTKEEGWVGVDIVKCPGVDVVHDLNRFPWPFKSDSVDEVFVSHYVEHIPLDTPKGDGLILFMEELYRILKPGAKAKILAPYYNSIRCWQDPTHRRAISEATFLYFNQEWRKQNKLDHYPIHCNFDFEYGYLMPGDWANRSDDAKVFAVRHYSNAVNDIQVVLTKK